MVRREVEFRRPLVREEWSTVATGNRGLVEDLPENLGDISDEMEVEREEIYL